MATKTTTARTGRAPAPVPAPLAPQNAALAKLSQNFAIELAPFADGEKLLAFHSRAAALVVVSDKASHQTALELVKEGKSLKRGVEEHWRKITRWLDDRKTDVRAIMNTDLELAGPDLDRIIRLSTDYEEADRRRVAEEQARQRQEQERIAREAREAELAALEKKAQEAEQASEELSDRERAFVQRCYAALGVDLLSEKWLNAAAKGCGFKQDGYGAILYARQKIQYAIEAMKTAVAIRQQAEAVEQKPIEVKQVDVQSNVGHVSGVRPTTSWTGECFDYRAFVEAFQRGDVDIETFCAMTQPSETGGNAKARALHENLDRIPGWRHIKKVGKAA